MCLTRVAHTALFTEKSANGSPLQLGDIRPGKPGIYLIYFLNQERLPRALLS